MQYKIILSQDGSESNPFSNQGINENTIAPKIVWTRLSQGEYEGQAQDGDCIPLNVFNPGITHCIASNADWSNNWGAAILKFGCSTESKLKLLVFDKDMNSVDGFDISLTVTNKIENYL